jgi:DNA-binding Lrp family transcriptional regulator
MFLTDSNNIQMEIPVKNVEVKLLSELMKNSRRSDRELAKAVGVSQPTVSRMIKKLEDEHGLRYTAIADLPWLGFEILAFTFVNRRENPTRIAEAQDFLNRHSNQIIFASPGLGTMINSDRVMISVHKDYSDYSTLIRDVKAEWGSLMKITASFLVSLSSDKILRELSLHYLFENPSKLKKET